MATLTAFGAFEMYKVVEIGGVTALEWVLVGLFCLNFSWIALAFTAALAGFFRFWSAASRCRLCRRS